jgi:DNA-binding XRE family transcriptional regulator
VGVRNTARAEGQPTPDDTTRNDYVIEIDSDAVSKLMGTLTPQTPTNRPPGDSQPSKPRDTFRILDAITNTHQLRAARALLGWDQAMLARRAGVSVLTIKRIETGAGNPQSHTLSKVADALADAGIVPIEDGNGGIGVLLRRQ